MGLRKFYKSFHIQDITEIINILIKLFQIISKCKEGNMCFLWFIKKATSSRKLSFWDDFYIER